MNKKIASSYYGIFTSSINEKKLIYYPCPKNANSSAKLFFAQHLGLVKKNYKFIGDSKPRYKQNTKELSYTKELIDFLPSKQAFSKMSDKYIKCCITRDPIDRFKSAYRNRILYHKDKNFRNHSIDEILSKLVEGSFDNEHFLPQTFFLGENINYFDFFSNINNITFFQDKVNEFFNRKIIFPKIQIGGNEIKVLLTKKQISKIEKIYYKDYIFLEKIN